VTARGQKRRDEILEATARLAAQHGFHAVRLTDIGAAAGVTGSALYRHFSSKEDVLVALFDRVTDTLLETAAAVVATAATPAEALDQLIAHHIDFALRDRAVIAVYQQQLHALPERDRRRLRQKQRAYAAYWVRALRELWEFPELPAGPPDADALADAAVRATFGMINSVAAFRSRLGDDRLHQLLTAMAKAALLIADPSMVAPVGTP
jgi:AcrR family transcriptional regulator